VKKVKFIVTLVVLMSVASISLTACGPNRNENDSDLEQSGKGDQSTWLETAALDKEFDEAALYEAAKKEGKVVLYSMSSRTADVKTAFEEKYPGITIDVYDMRITEIIEKVEREHDSGVYNADVVFIKDPDGAVYNEFIKKGILHNYVPSDIGTKMEEQYKEPAFAPYFEWRSVYYNSEVYKEPPISNWWDLTLPEWRGKIMISDPLTNNEDMGLFLTMINHADEMATAYKQKFGKDIELVDTENAGYEFIKRLAKNDLIFTNSSDEMIQAVGAAGQEKPPIGIGTSSKIRQKSKGYLIESVREMQPKLGTTFPAILLVVDNAPHVNSAKLLIHFMAGDTNGKSDGFKPFNVEGAWPTRSDVEGKGVSPRNSDFWPLDLDFNYENMPKLRDFWMTVSR
jgi:iron(III) transport system substrate-binding protein